MSLELSHVSNTTHTSRDSESESLAAAGAPEEPAPGSSTATGRRRSERHVPLTVRSYVVREVLGRGGQGVVVSADDPALERIVAIKLLHDESRVEQVINEARAAAQVVHPNTVSIFACDRWNEGAFIVMEYMPGGSLRDWAEADRRPVSEVLARYREAGRGLAAIHDAGLVHRDFKPENVLLRQTGTAAVADFGLARPLEGATQSRSGTRRYMAPELLERGVATPATDQYAFCVSLFRTLTARDNAWPSAERPLRFPEGNPTPDWVRAIIERGLSADPRDRFPSMRALVEALERDPELVRRQLLRNTAVGALVVALSTAALVALLHETPEQKAEATCLAQADAQADALWTPARVDAMQKRAAALAGAEGTRTFEGLRGRLEREVQALRTSSRAACRVTDATRRQVTQACLQERRFILEAQTDFLAKLDDRSYLKDAVRTLSLEVKPVEDCEPRSTTTLAAVPTPEEATLRSALAPAIVLRAAGRPDDARKIAVDVRHQASAAPRVELEARLLEAQCKADVNDLTAAQNLRDTIALADGLGADELRARAWISLMGFHARRLEIPAAAEAEKNADAIIKRLGSPPVLLVPLLNQRGNLEYARDDLGAAHAAWDEAWRLLLQTREPGDPSVLHALNNLLLTSPLEDRVKGFEELAARVTKELGATHPETLFTRHNLAAALRDAGRCEEAVGVLDELVALRTEGGPHLSRALGDEFGLRARVNECLARNDAAAADQRQNLQLREGTMSEQQACLEWSWLFELLNRKPGADLNEVRAALCRNGCAPPDGKACP
ncbi:MAG: serine/threonine-protein kinase [Myxococcaceae bacterium]